MTASTRGAAATAARRRATTPPPHVIAAELPPERPYHVSLKALLEHVALELAPEESQAMMEALIEHLVNVTALPTSEYEPVAKQLRELAEQVHYRLLLIRAAEVLEARHRKHIE